MTVEELIKYLSTITNTQKEIYIDWKKLTLQDIKDTPSKIIIKY